MARQKRQSAEGIEIECTKLRAKEQEQLGKAPQTAKDRAAFYTELNRLAMELGSKEEELGKALTEADRLEERLRDAASLREKRDQIADDLSVAEAFWELLKRRQGVPTSPQPEQNGHPAWPDSLLAAVKGAPLCLIMDEDTFLNLIGGGKARKRRQENFRRYVKAGADVAWLLRLCPPGQEPELDGCFEAFKRLLDQAGIGYETGPLKQSFEKVLAGLPKPFDRGATGAIQALVRNRAPRLRRWTSDN